MARGVSVSNSLRPALCKIPDLLCELFPNQVLILDYLMEQSFTGNRIATGTSHALLNLRAGMGKTFVAAGLIARLQMRTLYVVPSVVLAEQATKDFKGCFSSGVCWMQTGSARLAEEFVTVVVINTALKQPPTFFAQYGLVIYDEVHTYCTDKRADIFRRCCPVAFGMSATTDQRNDTFDMISHAELTGGLNGRVYKAAVTYAEQIPGFTYDDVHFDTLVTVIKYNGPAHLTRTLKHPSTDKMFTPWMHEQFLSDPQRTAVAVEAIKELYNWRDGDKQHRIFVFCEEREPLKALYELLRQSFEVDAPELRDKLAEETGHFVGGIKPQEIARCKQSARLLLTTYGYSSTGVSIAEMTACVFWTSRRSNMLQILSRILRRSGDQSIRRRVIDIVDNRTPMRSQYYERRNAYTYFGMDIEVKKINAEQI
jgi:superfamily II DNA or RNA helicase